MSRRSRAARRRRRRRQRRSRIPAILFAAVVAVGAGYVLVRASDDGGSQPLATGIETTDVAPSDTASNDSGDQTSDTVADTEPDTTDASNLGEPVKIFSDTLGDLEVDQVIDDWTAVDPPQLPAKTSAITPSWVSKGRITVNLPDGYYWGVPVNTFDEEERGINFDVRQVFWGKECTAQFGSGPDSCLNDYQVLDTADTQLYPSYLGDLLYVSFAVYGSTGPATNMAVSPSTFWSLLAAGEPSSVTIPNGEPEPASVGIAGSPFLLTIVDGAIIAAEGVWVP